MQVIQNPDTKPEKGRVPEVRIQRKMPRMWTHMWVFNMDRLVRVACANPRRLMGCTAETLPVYKAHLSRFPPGGSGVGVVKNQHKGSRV